MKVDTAVSCVYFLLRLAASHLAPYVNFRKLGNPRQFLTCAGIPDAELKGPTVCRGFPIFTHSRQWEVRHQFGSFFAAAAGWN